MRSGTAYCCGPSIAWKLGKGHGAGGEGWRPGRLGGCILGWACRASLGFWFLLLLLLISSIVGYDSAGRRACQGLMSGDLGVGG